MNGTAPHKRPVQVHMVGLGSVSVRKLAIKCDIKYIWTQDARIVRVLLGQLEQKQLQTHFNVNAC